MTNYLYLLFIPVIALCLYNAAQNKKTKSRLDTIEKLEKPVTLVSTDIKVTSPVASVSSVKEMPSMKSSQPEKIELIPRIVVKNEWILKISVDDDETYTIVVNWSDGSCDVITGNAAKEVKILRDRDGSSPIHTVNIEKEHLGTTFSWELNGFFWS